MLKARIKIFTAADRKNEISRFVYVSQGPVHSVRDAKEEIEAIFFRALNIKKHILSIADSEGYIFSEWLPIDKVFSDKVNLYLCDESCNKCKNNEVEEYTYETEEESKEKQEQVEIKIEVPPPVESKQKALLIPKKTSMLSSIAFKRDFKRPPFTVHSGKPIEKGASPQKESTATPTKSEGASSISEKKVSSVNINESTYAGNNIIKASTLKGASSNTKENECDEATDDASSTNIPSTCYSTSADEGASDSSTGRKYILKRSLQMQPVRKMQVPTSRYGKRK
ncbi:hypothetical protein NERG_01683 [Nematocida ausubeli]|uniref:Uncharacterized protein n=1 Tax=Nematocida ausubeli (strain ATCC PRA-371 / ERTm2) TaxID=1913371 RepID=H8ZDL2_NEMA1|nr:hypothetical protein NERG_01683 [Nematocida ausubeli]